MDGHIALAPRGPDSATLTPMLRGFTSLLVPLLFACSSGTDRADAGPGAADAAARDDAGGGDDAGSGDGCFEPMRECPVTHPHPGGPCEGQLVCPYVDDLGLNWTYSCDAGAWSAVPQCAGGCPVPPLSELCLDPFAGTLDGASVEMGPPSVADPFRPFAADERIEPIVGPQGGVMLPFRLRVSGVEAPDCLGVSVSMSVGGIDGDPAGQRVTMHCGESLGIYAVVPAGMCEIGVLSAHLEADVAGIGTTNADVTYDSPGCVM